MSLRESCKIRSLFNDVKCNQLKQWQPACVGPVADDGRLMSERCWLLPAVRGRVLRSEHDAENAIRCAGDEVGHKSHWHLPNHPKIDQNRCNKELKHVIHSRD